MKILKDWREKYSQKEKLQDLINRRESTMHNLLVNLTTEESINMFNEISVLFYNAAEKRLKEVNEEKDNLEKFLTIKAERNETV